jgi:predicted esterase
MASLHSFSVSKSARVFTLPDAPQHIQHIVIALHGYGQLAESFIRRFQSFVDNFPEYLVVAPEGLSRFYVQGFSGKVGASWMTKEGREAEIKDQALYLDLVAAHFQSLYPEAKLHVLGFSQGVATAWRWVANGRTQNFASLVLWAGEAPKEFPTSLISRLQSIPFVHVHALQDAFIPPHAATHQFSALQSYFPHIESIAYEGGHDIDNTTLTQIYKRDNPFISPPH